MKLTLDLPAIDFDDTAFLSIITEMPAYALVDDLNHLYDLSLHRTDDLLLDDLGPLPLYRYHNPLRHLRYWLTETHGDTSAYLLIVQGGESAEVAQAISDDFNGPDQPPHPADLPAVRRYDILSRYRCQFTVVSVVDFTSADIDAASRKKLPARASAHVLRADLFARILDYIDLNRLDE